jgi:hypothetical protein
MISYPTSPSRILIGKLGGLLVAALISTSSTGMAEPVAPNSTTGDVDAKALFGAFGSDSMIPNPPPPGYEAYRAVIVVEITSPNETQNATISEFVFIDQSGKETKCKRVMRVENFNRPRVPTEGEAAYYLNPGGTHPWNGTLPAGKIRLRITVALPAHPVTLGRFRVTVGQHVIEGSMLCEWPT